LNLLRPLQGLILCLFWNFIGGSALLITKSDQIAAWLWTALFLVGGVPGGYFLWYSRLYNAAIKDSAFGYAVFFAGFFANLAFSVWSAVGEFNSEQQCGWSCQLAGWRSGRQVQSSGQQQ
jgi:hypothetical protein